MFDAHCVGWECSKGFSRYHNVCADVPLSTDAVLAMRACMEKRERTERWKKDDNTCGSMI